MAHEEERSLKITPRTCAPRTRTGRARYAKEEKEKYIVWPAACAMPVPLTDLLAFYAMYTCLPIPVILLSVVDSGGGLPHIAPTLLQLTTQ